MLLGRRCGLLLAGAAGLVVMWIQEHLVDRAELVHVEKDGVAVIQTSDAGAGCRSRPTAAHRAIGTSS